MSILLKTDLLYTGLHDNPIEGFVRIDGNKITKVGPIDEITDYTTDAEVYDMYGKVVTPGFVDNHVFFTGYMWERIGFNASEATTTEELIALIKAEGNSLHISRPILGHGLNSDYDFDIDALEEAYPVRPVMVFNEGRTYCYMNQAAKDQYGFTEDECWAEMCWRLFKELLSDKEFARSQYENFQNLLAAQGITSIKEIGFDHYDGFTDVLKDFEDSGELKHRINLVSQPVRAGADFAYGEYARDFFSGDQIKYMGFNIMIDGDIESGGGHLIDGYSEASGYDNEMDIDYEGIRETVLEADKKGFRVALHAEGDAAVRKCIDIIEECRTVNGARDARHAIVDMEMIHPDDRARLAELNISCMQYIQIMNCYGKRENYWDERLLSPAQREEIWAYKSLLESGSRLCFGTDLPLDVPDIPLSVRFGCKRAFPEDSIECGYHMEEALTPAQILTCWTKNGQFANFAEDTLGTIEEGKLADIAVIDTNIFSCSDEALADAAVCMTIYNGNIVFEKEN